MHLLTRAASELVLDSELRVVSCPSRLYRVSVCAARTLNVKGQSRVTLSLQKEHLRAVCGPCQEERSLTFAQKRSSQAVRGRGVALQDVPARAAGTPRP